MPRHYLSLVFLILFWESFKFNTFFDVYAHWCLEIRGPVTTVSIFLRSCSVPSTLLLLSWFFLSWSLTYIPDTLFHRDECNDVGQPTYDLFHVVSVRDQTNWFCETELFYKGKLSCKQWRYLMWSQLLADFCEKKIFKNLIEFWRTRVPSHLFGQSFYNILERLSVFSNQRSCEM